MISPYSPWQVQLIRQELSQTKERIGYSWDMIASAIDEFFESLSTDLSWVIPAPFDTHEYVGFSRTTKTRHGNKLRVFAADNGRKSIDPMQLIATAIWLMYGVSSSLTYEKLNGLQSKHEAHKALAEFLNDTTDTTSALSVGNLCGIYRRTIHDTTERLTVGHIVNSHIVTFIIEKMMNEHNAQQDSEGNTLLETVKIAEGWFVIAPEERIYGLSSNLIYETKEVFMPLAIDSNIFQGSATGIALLKRASISYIDELLYSSSAECLDNWCHDNAENAILFKRIK